LAARIRPRRFLCMRSANQVMLGRGLGAASRMGTIWKLGVFCCLGASDACCACCCWPHLSVGCSCCLLIPHAEAQLPLANSTMSLLVAKANMAVISRQQYKVLHQRWCWRFRSDRPPRPQLWQAMIVKCNLAFGQGPLLGLCRSTDELPEHRYACQHLLCCSCVLLYAIVCSRLLPAAARRR